MSYQYRNKKTGEVITTSNKIAGKNWEPVVEEMLYSAENMEEPFEDVFADESTAEAGEAVCVEEAPAAKPKTSRKGKK